MSAPKIIVQFTMSKDKRIPSWVPERECETVFEKYERDTKCVIGEANNCVIEQTEQVALDVLLDDLKDAGYHLVSVWRQQRLNRKRPGYYHVLRFTFDRGVDAQEKPEQLRRLYSSAEDEFSGLLWDAFWRVKAYRNPGEDGASLLSINRGAPTDRLNPDGSERCEWKKDDSGNRVGTEPKPIEAKAWFYLDWFDTLEDVEVCTSEYPLTSAIT